jgi:hypothetical protein
MTPQHRFAYPIIRWCVSGLRGLGLSVPDNDTLVKSSLRWSVGERSPDLSMPYVASSTGGKKWRI